MYQVLLLLLVNISKINTVSKMLVTFYPPWCPGSSWFQNIRKIQQGSSFKISGASPTNHDINKFQFQKV